MGLSSFAYLTIPERELDDNQDMTAMQSERDSVASRERSDLSKASSSQVIPHFDLTNGKFPSKSFSVPKPPKLNGRQAVIRGIATDKNPGQCPVLVYPYQPGRHGWHVQVARASIGIGRRAYQPPNPETPWTAPLNHIIRGIYIHRSR